MKENLHVHLKTVKQGLAGVKKSYWVAAVTALCLFLGAATAVSAYTYTVRQGDTLFSISRSSGMTVSQLVAANNIPNPNLIHVGQQLEISNEVQAAPVEAAPSYTQPAAPVYSQNTTTNYQTNTNTTASAASSGSSTTYVVQRGDTLYRIAQRFGVSVTAVSQANNIVNMHQIQVGQVLVIPAPNYQPPAFGQPLTVHPFPTSEPSNSIPSTLPDAPNTPATTETDPEVTSNYACTRFNLAAGRDRYRGSLEGLYIMKEASNSQIASWYAYTGETDSGWINELPISFDSVHVRVIFIPAYGGGAPIQMEIVNPAGGTDFGWLTRGTCHSVEIQYPEGY